MGPGAAMVLGLQRADALITGGVLLAEPSPSDGQEFNSVTVSPGLPGFFATFVLAALLVLLLVDMARRVRRVQAAGRVRERYEGQDPEAPDAPDAHRLEDGFPGDGETRGGPGTSADTGGPVDTGSLADDDRPPSSR